MRKVVYHKYTREVAIFFFHYNKLPTYTNQQHILEIKGTEVYLVTFVIHSIPNKNNIFTNSN